MFPKFILKLHCDLKAFRRINKAKHSTLSKANRHKKYLKYCCNNVFYTNARFLHSGNDMIFYKSDMIIIVLIYRYVDTYFKMK